MTKATRTILFFVITLLFFVAAPATIFYTQGYRFDFEKKKVVQTGGIFIKALPKEAEVYLNGKFKKKTDFLFGQEFVGNLIPGNYNILVTKEGYVPWKKELQVQEKQLTTANYIFLIPKDPGWKLFEENVTNLWTSPTGKQIAIEKTGNGERTLEIKSIGMKNEREPLRINLQKLRGREIKSITWSPNEKRLLMKTAASPASQGITASQQFFLIDENGQLQSLSFQVRNLYEAFFHPEAQDKFLLLSSKAAGSFDVAENILGQSRINTILRDIRAFGTRSDGLFWITQEGHLVFGDLSGKPKSTLTKETLVLQNADQLTLFLPKSGNTIFLQKNDALFAFNSAVGRFEKIADSFNDVVFAPHMKMAAYFTPHEIFIFYFEAQADQPQKEAGANSFLTRVGERIISLQWLSNRYVLFQTDSKKIRIAEIDDRDGINLVEVPTPASPGQIFFNFADKKLYLISSGDDLFVSDQKFAP